MLDTSRMSDAEREAYWKRREDARTLAAAEEVLMDKERVRNARQGARELLEERTNELKGLVAVAGKGRASREAVRTEKRASQYATTYSKRGNVPDLFGAGKFNV